MSTLRFAEGTAGLVAGLRPTLEGISIDDQTYETPMERTFDWRTATEREYELDLDR